MNYNLKTSAVFAGNYGSRARYVINQGGTSSGKTYSILQVLAFRAMERPNQVITVSSVHLSTMRKGAIRDFRLIISEQPFKSFVKKGRSESVYEFTNGTIIEFGIFPDAGSAKASGKRDILFLNEANRFDWVVAQQLILRTKTQVFVDFNPDAEFWAHEKYLGNPEAQWFYSNWRHNEAFLDAAIIREIESLQTADPELYKIYGLGKIGRLEGQIFTNIEWIAPEEMAQNGEEIWGMDFGFANSYTTIVRLVLSDGCIYGKEYLYERGLSALDLDRAMQGAGVPRWAKIVADSSDPITISTLKQLGWDISATTKIEVVTGIIAMKNYKWKVTTDSGNWRTEAKNYVWKKDANGKSMNVPIKNFDHIWDAARYAFLALTEERRTPSFL